MGAVLHEEIDGERRRVSDQVQRHEIELGRQAGELGRHAMLIDGLQRSLTHHQTTTERSLAALHAETSTKADLQASERFLESKLEALHRENTLKLENLAEKVAPIASALSRVAWLVITAVILALLAIVVLAPKGNSVSSAIHGGTVTK